MFRSDFVLKNEIQKYYFYVAYHGLKYTGEGGLDRIMDEMAVNQRCPNISLVQVHVGTELKAPTGTALFVDPIKARQFIDSRHGCYQFIKRRRYLMQRLGDFTWVLCFFFFFFFFFLIDCWLTDTLAQTQTAVIKELTSVMGKMKCQESLTCRLTIHCRTSSKEINSVFLSCPYFSGATRK